MFAFWGDGGQHLEKMNALLMGFNLYWYKWSLSEDKVKGRRFSK